MPTTAENFKQYGVDPRAESLRLAGLTLEEQTGVFKQNLSAYKNEVVEDKAVSISYHYYFDSYGGVYTESSLKPVFNLELQIDKRERQGLPIIGIYRALELARNNPDFLVALYSPEGPAVFDNNHNNPFSDIKYDYGQLYLMYYDGEKVNALAIKINDEGKEWLEELLTVKFKKSERWDFEEIKTYVQTPLLLSTSSDFFNKEWRKNYLIYHNKYKKYYLFKLIETIKRKFTEKETEEEIIDYEEIPIQREKQERKARIPFPGSGLKASGVLYGDNFNRFLDNQITEEMIFRAYLSVIHRFLSENGQSAIELSGSCGGSLVTIDQVEMFLGIKNNLKNNPFPQMLSGFATGLRVLFNLDTDTWSEGFCIICRKKTMVGGCGFCKSCEHGEEVRAEKAKYN